MAAPNWLFFMLPHEHIFSSMDSMLAYLYDVAKCEDTNKLKDGFSLRSPHDKLGCADQSARLWSHRS